LGKTSENLGKILENPSKYGAQRLQKNTITGKTFFGITPKMLFVGKNLWANSTQNLFGKFGEYRAKILRTPKNLPAPIPMVLSYQLGNSNNSPY